MVIEVILWRVRGDFLCYGWVNWVDELICKLRGDVRNLWGFWWGLWWCCGGELIVCWGRCVGGGCIRC